jgi:2-polyprenyl-6-methoxyphenol hydroxylase-like FAD-dependent oxidoreductase
VKRVPKQATIIGGGIGGLCAAIALRMVGWDTDICEQRSELAESGAGIALAANAMNALERLGVSERVREAGARVGTGQIRTWKGQLLAELPVAKQEARYGTPSFLIHRRRLQAILHERLAELGGSIRWNKKLLSFAQQGDEVEVAYSDGERRKCDLLIGADGVHSTVRERLHGKSRLLYSGYSALRGIGFYEDSRYPVSAGGGFEALGPGSRFGFSHLGKGRIFWFAALNLPEGRRYAPEERHRLAEETFRDWYPPVPAVIAATSTADILFHPIHDRKPLRQWSVGSVTLLGDAAHPMLPNLGQGGAQAMEDALVLASLLRGSQTGTAIAAALQAYDKQRIPRTTSIMRQSRLMGRMMQLESPWAIAIRNAGLRAAAEALFVQRLHGVVGYVPPQL